MLPHYNSSSFFVWPIFVFPSGSFFLLLKVKPHILNSVLFHWNNILWSSLLRVVCTPSCFLEGISCLFHIDVHCHYVNAVLNVLADYKQVRPMRVFGWTIWKFTLLPWKAFPLEFSRVSAAWKLFSSPLSSFVSDVLNIKAFL